MAVLWTFREPSLGRHVRREFMRNAWLDFTPIIPTTACYQRNYVERYSRFNHRLAACAGHPAMIKDAAACHLHLQCDRKGWDKVLHLVHGYMSDLQERERDCRPGHCPPAIAGASVPQRHREP